jgi:hypothetical protein
MRYIALLEQDPPPQDWLDRAASATAEIEAEPNAAKRLNIIRKKAKLWSELKGWLLGLSNQKCWFSEAKDLCVYWEVEHFRPKGRALSLDKSAREGYWWLAFQWENYRICGRIGNARKGSYFPLGAAYSATSTCRDTLEELPYLLDPTNKHDCALLSFDRLGRAVPASGVDTWSASRVSESVRLYGLDFHQLELQRQLIWEECERLLNELANLMKQQGEHPGVGKKVMIESAFGQIDRLASKKSVCSSVVLACLQKSEYPWARALLAHVE